MLCLGKSRGQNPRGLRPLGFWPRDLLRHSIHHDTYRLYQIMSQYVNCCTLCHLYTTVHCTEQYVHSCTLCSMHSSVHCTVQYLHCCILCTCCTLCSMYMAVNCALYTMLQAVQYVHCCTLCMIYNAVYCAIFALYTMYIVHCTHSCTLKYVILQVYNSIIILHMSMFLLQPQCTPAMGRSVAVNTCHGKECG